MRPRFILRPYLFSLLIVVITSSLTGGMTTEPPFTRDFGIEPHDVFVPHGGNRFVHLKPGRMLRLEGHEGDAHVAVEISVLHEVEQITFVLNDTKRIANTRVVEEREWRDGVLTEVNRNFLARCPRTNNVFLFGEDVSIYEGDELVDKTGSWLAGRDGASPGLMMPGLFLLGARYYQEQAPGVTMGRSEHVAMNVKFQAPAGIFEDCVVIEATDDEDEDEEVLLIYAPGVGLIADDNLHLTSFQE